MPNSRTRTPRPKSAGQEHRSSSLRSNPREIGQSAVTGAPVLLLVSWAKDGKVVDVEPEGVVHASTDGGQTWVQRGRLAAARHALTAAGGDEVFAAVDGAILASNVGGPTFTVRHRGE